MAQEKRDEENDLNQPVVGDEENVYKIESVCMKCHKNGLTQILPLNIPYYKQIIVTSFSCPHCEYHNNEIMQGEEIKTYGIRYILHITDIKDYDRMVVCTDYTNVNIPQLELDIPPSYEKAEVTTIEGIIRKSHDDLERVYGENGDILKRKDIVVDKVQITNLRTFIMKLANILENKPTNTITTSAGFDDDKASLGLGGLTIILDDPSGNCFIENPLAPMEDPALQIVKYERTPEQNIALDKLDQTNHEKDETNVSEEVLQFPCQCSSCGNHIVTNMKITKVPHFDEIIIMATNCDKCGYKNTEVKPGGGIKDKGIRIELAVKSMLDLKREIIKSETCSITIPEIDLELSPTTLGSKYSTVEGILVDIKTQLAEYNPFAFGDSSKTDTHTKYQNLLKSLNSMALGERFDYTLILDDPAGNSHITKTDFSAENKKYSSSKQVVDGNGNEDYLDPNIKYLRYTRTWAQNEALGLNDMKI